MVEEEEGHDDEERWRKGIRITSLLCWASYCFLQYVPASSSQNFTPVIKLGFLQCAWEGGGGGVADGRDGEGGRWERWAGWQMGEMGIEGGRWERWGG